MARTSRGILGRCLAAGWMGLIALAAGSPARAAAGDTVADRVLGQRRFSTAVPYFVDGTVLDASDIAIDRSASPNHVYVAAPDLNRVLGWSDIARFRAGLSADLVLGQPSVYNATFAYDVSNCPAVPGATTLCRPTRLAVDPAGNLYVLDAFNFRVLEFNRPFATDTVADRVFGQASFTARRVPGQASLEFADSLDLAVDRFSNLWTIDPGGSRRILEYDAPLSHDTRPDRVIEPATADQCSGSQPRLTPCDPVGLAVSPQEDLLVQDLGSLGGSDRELVYRHALSAAPVADFTLAIDPAAGLPEGAFDAAGDLIFRAGSYLWRYAAPIGPGSRPEIISAPLATGGAGPSALDSQGSLYSATYGSFDSFVWYYAVPFQTAPARIGRTELSPRTLAAPNVLAIDRSSSPNHLYVVDAYNRVLGWRDAAGFADGAPADLVLAGTGQTTSEVPSTACFNAPPSATTYCPYGLSPGGLAVDSHGNLWMSDGIHNRVLELDRPFESDAVADHVLGQGGSFTSGSCNLGGIGARSLCSPGALAFDGQDHLYVADLENHRVLRFDDPLTDDTASEVFGQPDFLHSRCNQGRSQPGASTLCLGGADGSHDTFGGASSLAVDGQGNLYVADTLNFRVLIFASPLATGAAAVKVIGQSGFTERQTGTSAQRFSPGPLGVAVAPAGELYVADPGNDRVLEFDRPLRSAVADRVFGHANFTTGGTPFPSLRGPLPPVTASTLHDPQAVAVDAEGNLYVADTADNRVLEFDRP
jgi:sugar lactone lactonase YvrE